MIKIIYGVENNSSVCKQIYPKQDKFGLSSLIDQSIIKNDYKEELIGSYFFSIRCIGNFYVFSKVCLVYDRANRASYRSYIIASDKHERDFSFLRKIEQLEQQYTSGEDVQQDEHIKSNNAANSSVNNIKKKNVTVYYKDEEELEKYFKIDMKYNRFNAIYFIDEKHIDTINVLRNSGNVIPFDVLISNDYCTESDKNQKKSNSQRVFSQIYKNRIVILLFGILLGIGCSKGYRLIFNKRTEFSSQISDILNLIRKNDTLIIRVFEKVEGVEESIKNLSKKFETPLSHADHVKVTNDKNLPSDVNKFLVTDCKTMTLDAIVKKIQSFPNWQNIKNLNGLANFVTLIAKNPPKKEDIGKFMNDFQLKFNEQDEYVKFVKYLANQNETFFNKNSRSISGIYNQSLKDIEEKYGYNQ